jgi:hypothetical protein
MDLGNKRPLKLNSGCWARINVFPMGQYPELERHQGHWAHLQKRVGKAWLIRCRCGEELQLDSAFFNIKRLQEPLRALRTLEEALFDAWQYPILKIRQEDRGFEYSFEARHYIEERDKVVWAIREGLQRLAQIDPVWGEWSETTYGIHADCAMGHKLLSLYYRPPGWEGLRFCPACMAMILYFNKAHLLPPARYIAWDCERNEPVSET